jgi:hypothetical protein
LEVPDGATATRENHQRGIEMSEVAEMTQREVPAVTPMAMLEIAVQKGADIEQLTKLMELQERWEANEARKAFTVAMSEFKANPPEITKNNHVSFGKTEYDHATLDHVTKAISEAMSKHGLSFTWSIDQQDSSIKVSCVVSHKMGHSERVSLSAGSDQSGGKNSIQAVGSTVTYLQRYTLLAATGLAAKGQDRDGFVPVDVITDEQSADLDAKIKESKSAGILLDRLLKAEGIGSLSALPSNRFESVMEKVERYVNEHG